MKELSAYSLPHHQRETLVSVRGILFNLQSSLVFMEKECLAGSCSIYFVKSQNSKINTCYFKKLSWSFCLVGEIWYNEFSYFLFNVSDWSAMGTRLILRETKFPHSVSVPVSLMLFFFFIHLWVKKTTQCCGVCLQLKPPLRLKIASVQEIIVSLGHTGTLQYKIKIKVIWRCGCK